MEPPSYPITRGHPAAGGLPDGKVMVGENVIDAPGLAAVIARVPLLPDLVNFAVSDEGAGARAPPS